MTPDQQPTPTPNPSEQPPAPTQQPVTAEPVVVPTEPVTQQADNDNDTLVVNQGQNSEVVIYQDTGGLVTLHQHERESSTAVIAIVICIVLFNIFGTIHVVQARAAAKRHVQQASPIYRQEKSQDTFGGAVQDRPDGTLDMSKQITDKNAVANQDITFKLKQQVNLYNGMSFIVTSMNSTYKPTRTLNQAKAGQHYIKVYLTIGNRTDEPVLPILTYNLSEGGKIIAHDVSQSILAEPEGTLLDFGNIPARLEPKEAASGYVVISVPDGHKPVLEISKTGVSSDLKGVVMKASIQL